ncbi:MAG: PPC domain-containing DNA-binding protein [Candidatus Thorarchaeota archaeon]
MRSIESNSKRIIVAKIEPNEDLIDSIVTLVNKYNIKSGIINCIGALKKFTIGFYDINSRDYNLKTFEEYVELISCIGNISYKDKDPVIHLHVSLGRSDYTVIGGHLSQPSIISVTGEVKIIEIEQKLLRAEDPQFKLSLLDL